MWVGFFCSSLIKANDGLSRSLYAHHRQTVGCNELLSGTWRISRKQAAGLVSALLIAVKKKSAQHRTKREKKLPSVLVRIHVGILKIVAFSPWYELSRGKRKLIFSLPKSELLRRKTPDKVKICKKNLLYYLHVYRQAGFWDLSLVSLRCVFRSIVYSCNLIFWAKADKRRTEPRH